MKELLLTFNLLCGADVATTLHALHTGQYYEAVWPVQNPGAIVAINAGQCTAVSIAGAKLPKKVGWPLLALGIGLRSYAVAHNLRALQQHP